MSPALATWLLSGVVLMLMSAAVLVWAFRRHGHNFSPQEAADIVTNKRDRTLSIQRARHQKWKRWVMRFYRHRLVPKLRRQCQTVSMDGLEPGLARVIICWATVKESFVRTDHPFANVESAVLAFREELAALLRKDGWGDDSAASAINYAVSQDTKQEDIVVAVEVNMRKVLEPQWTRPSPEEDGVQRRLVG